MNPKVADPPAATDPFQDRLWTVTPDPLTVWVPPQSWLMLWPAARSQVTVQLLRAALPACTVTWPWKPCGQELAVW
jgi:hypothetical protein